MSYTVLSFGDGPHVCQMPYSHIIAEAGMRAGALVRCDVCQSVWKLTEIDDKWEQVSPGQTGRTA